MAVSVENLKVNLPTMLVVFTVTLSGLLGFYTWAEDKHESVESLARATDALVKETTAASKSEVAVLNSIVTQQAALITTLSGEIKAAKEAAQLNRELLIRVETKLETTPQ